MSKEIEVIKTLEEFKKFINNDNFMEIVVRQKDKRFKKFYKVAIDNIVKEAQENKAANAVGQKVLQAAKQNSKLLNKNIEMVTHLSKVQNFSMVLNGLNLCSTCAGFAILYEKLDAMQDEIVDAIQQVQETLHKGTQLKIQHEYNQVLSTYQDMLDCRKKQKPYSEENMRKLVDSQYALLDLMIESLKSGLISNVDNIVLSVSMMLSMFTTSLRYFDEQYYFNNKDVLKEDEIWHLSHDKWMSLYDVLNQSWFIELLQDHGVFDLNLNTIETDAYYTQIIEEIQDQRQDVIDNQELILELQDVSLLSELHELTSNDIKESLEKEISDAFEGMDDNASKKLYDSLHQQVQFA